MFFWPLHAFASPSQPLLALLALPSSVPASFASTGSCILPSPTSPLSTGVCVWHLLAACSAPAPMGRPKGSSTCPARKVCAGRLLWGLGRLGLAFLYSCASLCSTQGPPLRHLRLQPLHKHGLWEASSAATGGHGGHGLVVFGIIGINRTRQVDNHVIGDPVRAPTLDSCQRAPPQQADEQLPVQGPPAQLPTPTLSSLTAHPAQTGPPRTPGASFLLRMEQGRAFRITQESGTKPAALHH